MIRYSLECSNQHQFDAWFRNSGDYDRQRKRELVKCPECGVTKVDKALMAPSVVASGEKRRKAPPPAAPTKEQLPVPAGAGTVPQSREQMLLAMRDLRRMVEANSEYVGENFAEEARKIHYAETDERSIYGEASLEEARDLLDEGIGVLPLPRLPEDGN